MRTTETSRGTRRARRGHARRVRGTRRMPPRIRPAWPGAAAGRARPFRCGAPPGTTSAIHVAVDPCPAGSALVVDVGEVPERGYWGRSSPPRPGPGLAGLVIDGGVRDVAALERLAFPVFSSTIALPGRPSGPEERWGSTTAVAGVPVASGDWVVADVDGVVVVPGRGGRGHLSAGRPPGRGRGPATSPPSAGARRPSSCSVSTPRSSRGGRRPERWPTRAGPGTAPGGPGVQWLV